MDEKRTKEARKKVLADLAEKTNSFSMELQTIKHQLKAMTMQGETILKIDLMVAKFNYTIFQFTQVLDNIKKENEIL